MPSGVSEILDKLERQGTALDQKEARQAQARARHKVTVHKQRIGMIKSAGILDLPNREFREFLVEYAKSKARRDARSKIEPPQAIAAE